MKIKLSPQRLDDTIAVEKYGNSISINGEVFDFSRMQDGDTLPRSAIESIWFGGPGDDVTMVDGDLVLTLTLPLPWNYSQAQAFPVDLVNVPDGRVGLPQPLPITSPPSEDPA